MVIKGWQLMFDYDGDGYIDQFDELMTEYELQLMEDELFMVEMERRGNRKGERSENRRKSCSLGIEIVIIFVIAIPWKSIQT